ncbi:MAG TPA: hypothetical protein VGU64_04590, partial [Terriglobales bacterium]|nr:hypothetical protein [Terriglobales bacterium]
NHPLYPRIVQGEMMSGSRGRAPHLERIAKQYFRPVFAGLAAVLREGQARGEFRAVDPMHFIPSMIAMIVFYFTNAPVMRMVTGRDPFSPEFLHQRRVAVLDFISAALFRSDERSQK